MINIILGAVIAVILLAAVGYIVKEKKRGVRCIGCPNGGTCGGNCGGSCDCGCGEEEMEKEELAQYH